MIEVPISTYIIHLPLDLSDSYWMWFGCVFIRKSVVNRPDDSRIAKSVLVVAIFCLKRRPSWRTQIDQWFKVKSRNFGENGIRICMWTLSCMLQPSLWKLWILGNPEQDGPSTRWPYRGWFYPGSLLFKRRSPSFLDHHSLDCRMAFPSPVNLPWNAFVQVPVVTRS